MGASLVAVSNGAKVKVFVRSRFNFATWPGINQSEASPAACMEGVTA